MLGGCGGVRFKGGPGEASGEAAAWPFTPATIRVHPFTSIKRPPDRGGRGGAVLDARIQLLDRLGDATKGVGRFRFELYAGAAGTRGPRERLNVWQAPLTTIEQNARHYDSITHAYAFQLDLDEPPPRGEPTTLTARFTTREGRRLTAEAVVRQAEANNREPG